MTAYEKWEAQRKQRAIDAFNEHVVVDHTQFDLTTERLLWCNPKSTNYSVVYLRHRGTLFVGGDCYESTYQWSEEHSLNWMAELDFGYFLGKIRAASTAGSLYDWVPEIAREKFHKLVLKGAFSQRSDDELDEGEGCLRDKHDWERWLSVEDYDMDHVDIGEVPGIMPYLHWSGLQQAFKWLAANRERP